MYSRPLLSLNKIFRDLRRFEIVCGGERGRCTQVIEAYRYSYFHIFRTGPTENNISIVSIDQTTFLKITCKESSPEDMSATNFIFILFFHMLMNVLGFAVPQIHGENNHCTITVHVEPNGSLKWRLCIILLTARVNYLRCWMLRYTCQPLSVFI